MLTAIIETPAGTFKAYDQGDDWQITGEAFEQWCSIWSKDRRASFDRALEAVPQSEQATVYFIQSIDSAGD